MLFIKFPKNIDFIIIKEDSKVFKNLAFLKILLLNIQKFLCYNLRTIFTHFNYRFLILHMFIHTLEWRKNITGHCGFTLVSFYDPHRDTAMKICKTKISPDFMKS